MILGAAILREFPKSSREAARRGVSGICVADESQRKTIPAARLALPTVAPSELMVNCPSRGPTWLKPSRSVAEPRQWLGACH